MYEIISQAIKPSFWKGSLFNRLLGFGIMDNLMGFLDKTNELHRGSVYRVRRNYRSHARPRTTAQTNNTKSIQLMRPTTRLLSLPLRLRLHAVRFDRRCFSPCRITRNGIVSVKTVSRFVVANVRRVPGSSAESQQNGLHCVDSESVGTSESV